MSELEALLLGIVQGLTEFLPISSSGHLILVPWLQDYTFLEDHEAFNKTFDVALHAGTLVAAISYFRHEVVTFLAGLLPERFEGARSRHVDERIAWAIAVGTVPAVIAGGLGAGFIEDHLGEPWMIGIQLIVFGALLGWADRLPQSTRRRRDHASATASTSGSPRSSPWRREPRARGSRSPPRATSASTGTPPRASPSCC